MIIRHTFGATFLSLLAFACSSAGGTSQDSSNGGAMTGGTLGSSTGSSATVTSGGSSSPSASTGGAGSGSAPASSGGTLGSGGGQGLGGVPAGAYCPELPEKVDSCSDYCSCWFNRCLPYDGLNPEFKDDFTDFDSCVSACESNLMSFGACKDYMYYRINNNPVSHCNDGAPTATCPG